MTDRVLKIGFRVDAGNKVGTGHMMEAAAIIKGLRKRLAFEPVFITRRHPFAEAKLRELGVGDVVYISGSMSGSQEAKKIVDILKNRGCGHLVIDLLRRSSGYYDYIRKHMKSTFVILDDEEKREIPATVAVNFSVTQDPAFYKKAKRYGTRYLIGPAYFPVNEEIKKRRPVKIRRYVAKVFVNQGGSDPYGLSAKIIRALERTKLPKKVDVVLGGALKERHKRELEQMKSCLKGRYRFFSNISQERLYKLVESSDLAISAAGNTLYELAFLGIPTLIICHHKRHRVVANAFERKGAAVNLGIGSDLSESKISEGVSKLINDHRARTGLGRKARSIIDGNGSSAMIDELVKTVSCG